MSDEMVEFLLACVLVALALSSLSFAWRRRSEPDDEYEGIFESFCNDQFRFAQLFSGSTPLTGYRTVKWSRVDKRMRSNRLVFSPIHDTAMVTAVGFSDTPGGPVRKFSEMGVVMGPEDSLEVVVDLTLSPTVSA